jgi:hypothetical protein
MSTFLKLALKLMYDCNLGRGLSSKRTFIKPKIVENVRGVFCTLKKEKYLP